MTDYYEDTIAAIATAMSPSGIGIVRISGKEAFAIADRIYRGKKGKRLADQKANTIHYGFIEEKGKTIDEVLVMLMRAPHSYTGEDTVEIDCHGGLVAVRKVLEAVVNQGARPGEPGEFTKRAFLNGRIDLSQAEAVMDIISAKNESALASSLGQLRGSVTEKIQKIRRILLHEVAYIESALDDPEHVSLEGYGDSLEKVVQEEKKEIEKLLATADQGKWMQEGIKTVILGKPNAGKSSLLNLLVGEDKAIVTDIAGTTRDVVEEMVCLQGMTLRILDTAGIREASDQIERMGIERARQHARDADLILYVADGSVPLDENDRQIQELIAGKKGILLLNKKDLDQEISPEEIEGMKKKTHFPILFISAKEKKGLEELQSAIREMFFQGEISFNDEVYITNLRHKKALEMARESLCLVEESIEEGLPEDFFSIDLTGAYQALGSILGESLGEDLVNEIFSKFCTGK